MDSVWHGGAVLVSGTTSSVFTLSGAAARGLLPQQRWRVIAGI